MDQGLKASGFGLHIALSSLLSRTAAMSGRQEPRSKHRHDPALEKYKKARQDMHPGFQPTSRRTTRAASSAAAQYAEGSGNSSSDTDTDEFRVESRDERKRKSTDRGSDGDSSDEEEEEPVPPIQHQPGQGMHYGLLETRLPNVPSYVPRVDYRGKGMTRRARDERRVDPRGLPKVQYDHRFQTAFHLDFYSSVILTRNPVIARSQWIDWQYITELQKASVDHAIAICQRTGVYEIMEFQHD